MKTRLSLFCIAMALIAASVADAQLARPLIGGGHARSAFQSVSGDLLRPSGGTPGRVWIEANGADRGLGFQGSYISVGAKTRLFQDRLDGRWLFEGQFNHSLEEEGGAFANIGIERVFSLDAAGADVSVGAWYDYDGDEQGNFAHTFHQVGVSGSIKTRRWDLIGNGYIPVGIQDYTTAVGSSVFFGNSIALTPGIDAALQGFDVTLRMRPKQIAFANGTFDVGAYHYNSDLIDAFGGGRVRLGFQVLNGMMVNMEVNHDERFDTTGIVGVGWQFGANASGRGHEYSGIGRDLDRTVRNDHIVRFNQEFIVAIDPDTGAAYNVIHVDNTADPNFSNGTAELPFATLASAQNGSSEGDIILVNAGDGTDRALDTGIRLKDNQRLLGTGSSLLLPIQGGISFELAADTSGATSTISNSGGFSVVQLADNNVVGGLNIDATGARFGIWGTGESGDIRDNTITNADEDGVRLNGVTGDWSFARNNISNNGGHGVFMFDALDPTSTITFVDNTIDGNGLDGIHLRNYDPAEFVMARNSTDNNLRNGLFLENYLNSLGNDIQVVAHSANGNAGNGVFMNFGSGNLDMVNILASNNLGAGVLIRNWATAADERIFIGTTEGGVSTLSNNRAPANLQFVMDTPGIDASALVTGLTLTDGVRGIGVRAEGVTLGGDQTTFDIDIIDNLEISRNISDGIRLVALDGGIINTEIGSTNPNVPLPMFGNAIGGGDGISLLAEGINGQPAAEINALIDNVSINNAVSRVLIPSNPPDFNILTDGIGITSLENAQVNVTAMNSTIGIAGFPNVQDEDTGIGVNILLDNDNNGVINRVTLDNLTVFAEFGVFMTTGTGTLGDLSLSNSTLLPNETQSIAGVRADNTPFDSDDAGLTGLTVVATGEGQLTGQLNMIYEFGSSENTFVETVSDGVTDNLTRVSLENNTIQDFTFEGVDIEAFGDAHLLVEMVGNRIQNNGAGGNNDNDNDDVFNEQGADGLGATADVDNLSYFDGVNINAFDQSVVSTRINNNVFVDNFERGLSLNTFNAATINALVTDNTFFGNDRGEDTNFTIPPIGTGNASGGEAAVSTAAFADFEAINNEEFYIRLEESFVLTNGTDGTLILPDGTDVPADSLGAFYPGNGGFDIFGNPVALGVASMNLGMSNNALQLGPDIQDFSVAPGDFQLGLDGGSNGFVGPFIGVTDAPFNQSEGLIRNEESFFDTFGF